MITAITATKVVVRDVAAAELFYTALGLRVTGRNTGGEGEVRQKQSWLSVSGDSATHLLILSQFLEAEAPPLPPYPREFWLAFAVQDVDATLDAVIAAGGTILRPGQDRPEHKVRAAVVTDNEGHVIEIVGPLAETSQQEHDAVDRQH